MIFSVAQLLSFQVLFPIAVSYTHLDVYKRQVKRSASFLLWKSSQQCFFVGLYYTDSQSPPIAQMLMFESVSQLAFYQSRSQTFAGFALAHVVLLIIVEPNVSRILRWASSVSLPVDSLRTSRLVVEMCIRDRCTDYKLNVVAFISGVLYVYYVIDNKEVVSMETHLFPFSITHHRSAANVRPVSYTHLDVYKRQ